jgi:hypothetical protein
MEALILLVDVSVLVYLCWRIARRNGPNSNEMDLGFLDYRRGTGKHEK